MPHPISQSRARLHPLTVKIPRQLFDQVRVLIVDPTTGRARIGSWQQLLVALLTRWITEQRSRPPEDH
jgi:hypothetical protein